MNTSEQPEKLVPQREMAFISCLPPPKDADDKTVRLCDSEEDAIAVSIVLSRCTQTEVANRMGVSRSFLTMLKRGERVLTRKMTPVFCAATGSNLIRQYRCVQSALRVMNGVQREEDRIAAIASHTLRAAA